jgi:dual specificity protein kinase YAK1
MWSFACLIAELSLGKPLFPGTSDLHQLAYMVNLMGYPEL